VDCKCLETIEAKLKAHHQSEVMLELKLFIDTNSHQMGAALPPLYYKYKIGRKWKKSYVHFTFCPFCGKKDQ